MDSKIDWAMMIHARGTAEDIPLLLDQLESAHRQIQEQALDLLWDRLCHQGTSYPVSIHSIPRLYSFLMTDGCHVKPRLLDLIGCIAMGLPDEYLLYEFTSRKATEWGVELVKLGPSAVQKASMSLDMTECKAGIYAFLCLHQSELVGLLQSEEELLRVKALYIMAWLKDFQSINWKIQHFLSTPNERGEIELGTAILAYWLNSLHSGLKIEEDVVRRFLDSRLKIVRAAAAIALAEQCNAEDAIEILVLVSQDESLQLGGRSFPFYNGDLPGLAQLVLDEQ